MLLYISQYIADAATGLECLGAFPKSSDFFFSD